MKVEIKDNKPKTTDNFKPAHIEEIQIDEESREEINKLFDKFKEEQDG